MSISRSKFRFQKTFDSLSPLKELEVFASNYGTIADGITDDTAAIQSALDAARDLLLEQQNQGLAGKAIVILAGGTYKISSTLVVHTGTSLRGETSNPPYPNRASGFRSNQNLFTGTEIVCSADFVGDYAIDLQPDNTSIENIILDGHSIPAGTTYTQINIRTDTGKYNTTGFIKFPVQDPEDFRIQGGLQFDNIEIPVFYVGEYGEFQLQAIGEGGIHSFAIDNGNLPNGLSLDRSGLISGVGTELDEQFLTFRVTVGANSFSRSFVVRTVLDEIKTRDILPPTVGTAYSFFLETYKNSTDTTWEGVSFPDWLTLIPSTGELTAPATTTADDVAFYEIEVRLKQQNTGKILDTRAYVLELRYQDGGLRIFGDQILIARTDQVFNYQYRGHGGYGSFIWSINESRSNAIASNTTVVTSTSPFAGLSLNPNTAEITGQTNITGKNSYYLRATSTVDSNFFYEALYYIVSEGAGDKPKIYTRSIATATKGQPYSFQFSIQSVPETVTYEAVNLPTGLSISSTGLITATPVGARYVSGVKLQWSTNVRNCSIRGFRSGGGLKSPGASNVHRISSCLISVCDTAIWSQSQTWDSHFLDLYLYNCRVGIECGSGTAGNTFEHSRIEFIHEYGIQMNGSNENDFSSLYLDTCGRSAIRMIDSRNNLITGCRLYRSGRVIRGTGTKFNSKANRDYSNHIYLSDCKNVVISGNQFDAGTDAEGSGLYLHDDDRDNVRPYVGIRVHNTKELTVVGNGLAGCVTNALDANLTDFGENSFKGWNIANNSQSDYRLQPVRYPETKFYIPNQCFQIWQRDFQFLIPPAPDDQVDGFEVADGWRVTRGGNSVIDQNINVSLGTDAPVGDGTYLHLDKPLNTTAPSTNNFQTLELGNIYSKDLKLTSDRAIIFSYYARSDEGTTLKVKLSQYFDASNDGVFSYSFLSDKIVSLSSKWRRYQHYIELGDLKDIVYGANPIFNIVFILDQWDEAIDLDITGVQLDFVDQAPFAQELRVGRFEDELAFAQLRYQKSKEYGQYLPSWSDGQRYDLNGANWQPGFIVAYSPTADGGQMTTTVAFDNPILAHPGFAGSANGILPNIKLINPGRLSDRTHVDKYTWAGSGQPSAYIDTASKKGFQVSARNGSTTATESYSAHWLVSFYDQDIISGGGYFE